MASYRYTRDISPDNLQPDAPKEYSQKEKRKNWWHYHWKIVAAAMAGVILIGVFAWDIIFETKPDHYIGLISPYSVPESALSAMQTALESSLDDVNGDGKVAIMIETYVFAAPTSESAAASTGSTLNIDPNMQMAGVTRLTGALQTGEPAVFIIAPDEMEQMQENYALFGHLDGSAAPENEDIYQLTTAWKDSPFLSSLPLSATGYDDTEYDAQELFQDYRIGIRPFEETVLAKKGERGKAKWDSQKALLDKLLGQ